LDEKIVRVLRDQFKPLKNKYDSSGQFIDEEPSCSSRPDIIGIYYTKFKNFGLREHIGG
jgi:hypothetical protein